MKESILSSFIKYLKSFCLKEDDRETFCLKEDDREKITCAMPRGKSNRKESKLDLHRGEIIKALDNGESKVSIARRLNTSQVNLYHWMKKRGIRTQKKTLYFAMSNH